jgi:hypothetical protein
MESNGEVERTFCVQLHLVQGSVGGAVGESILFSQGKLIVQYGLFKAKVKLFGLPVMHNSPSSNSIVSFMGPYSF